MLAHQIDDENRTKDVVVSENVTFESLLLSENTLKGLRKNGFKKPSPVQLKAVPLGRCGFDLIVKSKSGTGKTLVFSILALEGLKLQNNKLQVLILSPTREIAVQSQEVIKLVGCYYTGVMVQVFIGGLSVAEDKEKCKKCNIAVGTPGRIKQLINENFLKTDSVRLFVLDEADKLMEESFRNDINEIYNNLPSKKQIITTSATYPNQLEEFLSQYMLSPTHINTEVNTPLLLGLKQFVVITRPTPTVVQLMKLKNEELINIITNISFTQCLIFSNYQSRAESLSNILNQKGWPSTFISAAQTQTQRLEAINSLKEFKCRIMISTDLTARGIDAANVNLVINYDIPVDGMTYLHRMGRAGRYGSAGVCINLASEGNDLSQLQEILGYIGGTTLSIPKLPKFNGDISQLLKMEVPLGEHIYGTLNTEQKNEDNTKMFELTKNEKQQDKNADILNILNESKNEAEEIKKQLSDMDTDSILNSLLNQEFSMGSSSVENEKKSHKFDANVILKPLTQSSTKKRNNELKEPIKPAVSKSANQDNLLTKNIALLNVSKILSGLPMDADKLPIEQHLSLLKSQEKSDISELENKNTTDLLNMLYQTDASEGKNDKKIEEDNDAENSSEHFESSEENKHDSSEQDFTEFNVENLFQFGYKHLVKDSKKDWRKFLYEKFEDTLKKFENELEEDENDFFDADDSEESDFNLEMCSDNATSRNEDIQMSLPSEERKRKSSKTTEEMQESAAVDIMKWVPVEKTDKTCDTAQRFVLEADAGVDNCERFSHYYEECSNSLWQNGLSFDSAEAFDDWFYYEWEAQLSSVRNYIQQNVYINEMANYQRSHK